MDPKIIRKALYSYLDNDPLILNKERAYQYIEAHPGLLALIEYAYAEGQKSMQPWNVKEDG